MRPIGEDLGVLHADVEEGLFAARLDAKWWIGCVADHSEIHEPALFETARQVRAAVYVDEMGFLAPDHIDDEGREGDDHDEQAIHLVAVQAGTGVRPARLIGTMRLIAKKRDDAPLPIEENVSHAFVEPAPIPSVEVSRFIARHEDQDIQHMVAVALIRAATYQVLARGIDTAYFEVEFPLLRLLQMIGIPMEQIGDARDVREPGGVRTLYPLRVPAAEVPDAVKRDDTGRYSLGDFFHDEELCGGVGYFDEMLAGIDSEDPGV